MPPTPKLIVFAKAPRLGQVKSRLAADLGDEQACSIYKRLLDALSRNLAELKEVEWHITPSGTEAEFAPWIKPGWHIHAQCEGDLGDRLTAAFTTCEQDDGRIIIGSDCPYATASDIRKARKELRQFDVVIGPAIDGGYWLIALRRPCPDLFKNVDWSTDQALGQTLRNAKQLGLKVQLLRILSDIDTAEDYREWQRSTANSKAV